MKRLRSITTAYVDDLIDFAPTDEIKAAGIAELQKTGAVALFNMLVRNGVAYLADEVGMGKTYIGLAVMSLLRYQKPDARVLILTPRRNIQEKWAGDLRNFVRYNWKRADHRVKTPQGGPDFPVRTPDRLADWLNQLHDDELGSHDTILRTTSFSLALEEDECPEPLNRFRENLSSGVRKKFNLEIQQAGSTSVALRKLLSQYPYDLIIVDEAHNLKHGYQRGVPSSLRNALLHELFSNEGQAQQKRPWLLMLSATPMENGNAESMVRQFQVFGRENDLLKSAGEAGVGFPLSSFAAGAVGEDTGLAQAREKQKCLLVRRVGEIRIGEERYTRNMYRREWRRGGVIEPNKPMKPAGASARLVNGVLQKNIFEDIQAKSDGRFRIGTLESFEIYSGKKSRFTDSEEDVDAGSQSADQHVVAQLCESFRKEFRQEVPHPKLNAVGGMLEECLQSRKKALVFVRRVATTWDLATRASQAFDDELIKRIKQVVIADDQSVADHLQEVWNRKRAEREFVDLDPDDSEAGLRAESMMSESELLGGDDIESLGEENETREAVPSLFSWYYKGEHRNFIEFPDIYSGRRLREQLEARNRFCLILEENYVDWFLGRPKDILTELAQRANTSPEVMVAGIADYLPDGSGSSVGNIRRQYHFVQYAALSWMAHHPAFSADKESLRILRDEIYRDVHYWNSVEKQKLSAEEIQNFLAVLGIYPTLARKTGNSDIDSILARGVFQSVKSAGFAFRLRLRRREQIRQLQCALLRHGAPVVDLYLACLRARNGELVVRDRDYAVDVTEAAEYLIDIWEEASHTNTWSASSGWELAEVNRNFDLLKKLNFFDLDQYQDEDRLLDRIFTPGPEPASDSINSVRSVRRYLNQEMAGQVPTAAAQGGQSDERRHRVTTQFRMPGMPWILVATNVYEEGVDLHTYCRTVVHHGISATASSVEQRTGRVDRIGGLLQRSVASLSTPDEFIGDLKIQSLFPYQPDTFEKHQVRRVLGYCNQFLRSLHDTDTGLIEDRDTSLADRQHVYPQIETHLTSPFDVSDSAWLEGDLVKPDRVSDFSERDYRQSLQKFEELLATRFDVDDPGGQDLERHYKVGEVELHLAPHSHREGEHMLVMLGLSGKTDHVQIDANPAGYGWEVAAYEWVLNTLLHHINE